MTAGEPLLLDRDFAAVLFDMDGTLIDSTPSVLRSWARWAEEYAVEPARLAGMHGMPARGVIARLLPEELWAEAEARITALEIADVAGVAILPGATEALAALSGQVPERSAVATSCTTDLFEARIRASRLPHPRVVVTASDVTHGKPDAEPYRLAAHRLGVDPAQCLVVEDAPAGLRAGKAARCATLAVTTTTSREDLIATGDADLVVATLADVRFLVTEAGVRVTSIT